MSLEWLQRAFFCENPVRVPARQAVRSRSVVRFAVSFLVRIWVLWGLL